ncbi:MAG: FAD-dependent monooxygenase [Deltaproteobacteria bacterium]|nr:FAD-dependent monooxygenase [Deltaproteobacteria bacterium]
MKIQPGDFDAVVIGAGPAGCVAALAHARAGAQVLLLEANPHAARRLAGEWLHPLGLSVLHDLGLDPSENSRFDSGHGFAIFPDDGSTPVVLPYANGARGWSGEHFALVEMLRDAASSHPNVAYLPGARAIGINGQCVSFQQSRSSTEERLIVDQVIAADGRSSCGRAALGLSSDRVTLSRMAGLRLRTRKMPFEGYGHVFLSGPGPMLAYRIGEEEVRLCLDVPLRASASPGTLFEAYGPSLPKLLRPSFEAALHSGDISWAVNQARARYHHGRPGLALVGDAVGFHHPLTAAGMTFGMVDASTLVHATDFERWRHSRERGTRVTELLSGALYEIFASDTASAAAIRARIYELWRCDPRERERTMRFLSGEDHRLPNFARSFLRVAGPALLRLGARAARSGDPKGTVEVAREIGRRIRWLTNGAFRRGDPAVMSSPMLSLTVTSRQELEATPAGPAIQRGADALIAQQWSSEGKRSDTGTDSGDFGSWEGEVVWCPMLAAQFVMLQFLVGVEIAPERRTRLIRHFERTRLSSGLWGLHKLSAPYLFVTTLVYVAARLLGVESNDPLLAPAQKFIRREGVLTIPSWGKLWLALLGLYDWRGAPPLVPELWSVPEALPTHPSKFYCHTRNIQMAMSVLYGRKVEAPKSALLDQIRDEVYTENFASVDWVAARRSLRQAELATPPGRPLRAIYEGLALFERHHGSARRERVLRDLENRIRWELQSTDHTSISPVSGMLNILALRSRYADDPDAKRALTRLEAWVWEDDEDGMRIAGARSASWDTAFSLQALTAASPHAEVETAIHRGAAFLDSQQIRETFPGYREAYRLDPKGGWCFASVWHGWPVSDCTAEALEALLTIPAPNLDTDDARNAARFILGCQNPDGGFGSYEAQRSRVGLEWLNPAEMFGDSMTEHSYVECTASCIAALTTFRRRFPNYLGAKIEPAIARAHERLRLAQTTDGSWQGVWGVNFIYGTLFGVRGLIAAGTKSNDSAIRRACHWLRARQRADGGWGEDPAGCLTGSYIEHRESQVIQTAWALMTLLEARDPDWGAIVRGSRFLIERQEESGSWPRQDPAGVFFHTALLDYTLYRQYFPLWALSLYESRRLERLAFSREPAIEEGFDSVDPTV